ncbi:restriction endonuclease subunit S [Clostridium botulinum]|nr:restriction endonuclease subunit S [Clostridium botulinum]
MKLLKVIWRNWVMENNWRRFKLDECTIKITDGTHSTVKDDNDGDCYLLSCKNVKDGKILIGDNERRINKEQLENLRKRTGMQKNDTLITTVGTIGQSALIREKDINYEFQRSVAILRPKTDIINPEYLYYLTKTREFIGQAIGLTSGSVQKCLFLGNIKEVQVNVPSLKKQEKIVEVISSLDNKIELNSEMNKTLEEMAQAIFKSWFVDFEPFKDGEFEESELGLIPKGWKVCSLKNICNINMGQSPSSETYNEDKEGMSFYQGVKDFTERFPLVSTYCSAPKKVAMAGDILLSVRAPVGRINISLEKCCIGRGCASLSSEKYGNGFLYYLLRNIKWDKYESGTVFTSIKKSDIENYKVISPNIDVINKFNQIINSLDNRIYNNCVQNRDLENIRDTLLPKLISGEIEV